jgi:hypothetical protein
MPTGKKAARAKGAAAKSKRPRCGVCGKTGKLKKSSCCGQWICDDEDKYVIFSYARNSCGLITGASPCAATTKRSAMKASGRPVSNAATISRRSSMCGTGRTSTILRSWRIRRRSRPPIARDATR